MFTPGTSLTSGDIHTYCLIKTGVKNGIVAKFFLMTFITIIRSKFK